jgi:predicted choloylglycine hydrolase
MQERLYSLPKFNYIIRIHNFQLDLILERSNRREYELKHLRLRGTHYEIGRAYGESIRGIDSYQISSEEKIEFALKCEERLDIHAPDLVEELRGFSDGLNLDYHSVITTCLVPTEMSGCNLFTIKGEHTSGGHPFFVRHMDWLEEDLKHLNLLETSPHEKYTVLGFNFSDFGCYDGINNAGLAIGSASIPFYTGKNNIGLRENIATRWTLDNFSTVKEAVSYLKNIPHTNAIVFLIADKTGTSARVECTPTRVAAEISENSINIVCNFFILNEMVELDRMPKEDRAWNYYRRIKQWFSDHRKELNLEHVKEICRSHDNGICEHLDNPPGGTIYSWITELGTDMIHLAVGYPCRNKYQTYRIRHHKLNRPGS